MRFLFALAIALIFSLVSPALCQDGPDVFPDEHTRKIARALDSKSVKEIHFYGLSHGQSNGKIVTDPQSGAVIVTNSQTIALLIEGLKTANTTNFTNKVDALVLVDKDDRTLLEYRFSVSHFPELSSELIKGLAAVGLDEPRAWEERVETQRETIRVLTIVCVPLALLALLAFFFFKYKTRANR